MAANLEKLARDWLAAWSSHEGKKVVALYTDDCLFEDPPSHGLAHGKKELEALVNSMTVDFPDINFEFESCYGTETGAGVEWLMTGTQVHSSIPGLPATGKKFSIAGAAILELKNGKIKRDTEYWDFAACLQQLGLMPAQPGAPPK